MAGGAVLDFEKPILELEREIARLRESAGAPGGSGEAAGSSGPDAPGSPISPIAPELAERLNSLETRLAELHRQVYGNLTAWQRVQLARHPARPHALEYIQRHTTGWTELHGDRAFGDDRACVAGFAFFAGRPVAVIGQQKGADLKDNIFRNYGSMHPEGYRKALRVMKLAEKFSRPILVYIDTAGAFPGVGAEERGQAEAIARNIMEMSVLRVPVVCAVIGEGGSGGALGIGVGNRLLAQEYAYYSVISPEGCASILWRDARHAPRAAEALRLTAPDLLKLGVADEIVPEPPGGAHRDPAAAAEALREAIARHLADLDRLSADELLEDRFQKFRRLGAFREEQAHVVPPE